MVNNTARNKKLSQSKFGKTKTEDLPNNMTFKRRTPTATDAPIETIQQEQQARTSAREAKETQYTKKGESTIIRDETGLPKTLIAPTGERFSTDPQNIQKLGDIYAKERALPGNTQFSDNPEMEAQAQAQLMAQQEQQALQASAEQGLANIGQTDDLQERIQTQQDPLTQKIEQRNAQRNSMIYDLKENPWKMNPGTLAIAGIPKMSGGLIKALNKVTGGGAGEAIKSMPIINDYLNDYSNEDSYKTVKESIADAKAAVSLSTSTVLPGEEDMSIETYNNALMRLRVAKRQLKILSKEKGLDADTARDIADIDNYFANVIPLTEAEFRKKVMKSKGVI